MAGSLTGVELGIILVIVLLACVLAGVGLYILRRLHRRRDKLLGELKSSPGLVQDRAFNRIAMARREVEILARSGGDVSRAREQIAEAQGAFDTQNYDRAYQTAQSVHESLVHARTSTTPLPSSTERPATIVHDPGAAPNGGAGAASSPPPAASVPSLPKNQVESQFQLHLLATELDQARTQHAPTSRVVAADGIRQQAAAAYARGDYTEAFRLALRARRELGASVETLPPPARSAGPAAGEGGLADGPIDPGAAADRVASANRCPDCGYPMLAEDVFCRGCGRPKPGLSCPHCGASRGPKDTFCGRCGERYA